LFCLSLPSKAVWVDRLSSGLGLLTAQLRETRRYFERKKAEGTQYGGFSLSWVSQWLRQGGERDVLYSYPALAGACAAIKLLKDARKASLAIASPAQVSITCLNKIFRLLITSVARHTANKSSGELPEKAQPGYDAIYLELIKIQ
jgi:hypothetical protein